MNSIKQHFFLILPLIALLFSLESFILVNRAILNKEDKLLQNYSIIISSNQELSLEFIAQNIPEVSSLSLIDPNFILDKIRLNMSNADFESIKKQLSFYYTLKLSSFPDERKLQEIDSTLKKIPGVIKTESFSKTHNQVSKLLFFIRFSIQIFAILIVLLSTFLMIGQIRIWHFEHNKRVKIMGYLGASVWMKNRFLIKFALSDSIFASFIIIIGFLYFSTTQMANDIIETLGIQRGIFYFAHDFAFLLISSILISLVSVLVAVLFQRKI